MIGGGRGDGEKGGARVGSRVVVGMGARNLE